MKLLKFLIIFSVLMQWPDVSKAGIFGPSDKKDCQVNYAARAISERATAILNSACQDIFNDDDNSSFLSLVKSIFGYQYIEVAHNPNTQQEAIYNSSTSKWEYLSPEVVADLNRDFDSYKNDKIRRGKCIIGLDELYNAPNDLAASLIYNNSSCQN